MHLLHYCNSFLGGQLLHIAIFNRFFDLYCYCYCNSSEHYCQCLDPQYYLRSPPKKSLCMFHQPQTNIILLSIHSKLEPVKSQLRLILLLIYNPNFMINFFLFSLFPLFSLLKQKIFYTCIGIWIFFITCIKIDYGKN